jgi:hypothetical protein
MHNSFLAFMTAVIHISYACFVLLGSLAIVIGILRGWIWVRNFQFRVIHFLCTTIVTIGNLVSINCPLTVLEKFFLRASGAEGYNRSFIGNLLYKTFSFDTPELAFRIIYITLGILVVIYFILYPPAYPAYKFRWEK